MKRNWDNKKITHVFWSFFQEEELRASNDPKYQHLHEELHVEITAFAPPAEAHARVAYALTEVRKYLIPDSNDEIRQEQMREMEIMSVNIGDGGISSMAAALAAAQAAQAAAVCGGGGGDPMKRHATAAFSAAALRPAGAGQAAAGGLPQMAAATMNHAAVLRLQQQQQQQMHPGQARMAGSPYLAAAGAPLVRSAGQPGQPGQQQPVQIQQQQKLYNEELLLEAAAVSQAPVDINSGKDG